MRSHWSTVQRKTEDRKRQVGMLKCLMWMFEKMYKVDGGMDNQPAMPSPLLTKEKLIRDEAFGISTMKSDRTFSWCISKKRFPHISGKLQPLP